MTDDAATPETPTAHVLADADAALGAVVDVVRALPDDAVGHASPLPGWTRGHVLSHLAGVAAALARQAEYAARGETVAPYDGGQAGRAAAIEAGAGRTAAEHADALVAARERLAAAWPEPGHPLWDAPIAYRDGVLTDALLAWWREARIHAVDATAGLGGLSLGYDTWDPAFCAHLRDFLAVRLPDAWRGGDGGLELVGDPRDVAAWLAGREPAGEVSATRDGNPVSLPEMAPWPSSTTPEPTSGA
ncbi:maleylpyruvate isomerase family mycothiol-dependent enzyme [Isoptericola sp. NEAU-Y5]|uniref:Maleylpyruvate isomerase family mycothiol-dependent enzyme n=1 Tax=Isoptericola luteus TaxID=2879484 RepID=A0ABS7ZJE4_9MICO|nr:maleylpyruvate isomerase family mycothiol-dependent enzyme [Isoptericola sp. NEAU-Y5]MCA5893724.1 maleylpyruvate isomerase family mycothiol-dependent enzyme [Isoptericola sp. NEAU-Y5]